MNKKAEILIALFAVLGFWTVAAGRTIYVDDDGTADFNNIQAAIDDANDGDTVIVAKGTYYENIVFRGPNITLTSTNPNDEAIVAGTVIDGNDLGSVVTFSGSENTGCVLTGFTITNGYASGEFPDYSGGGIQGNGTMATISNCVIRNNRCDNSGGGLYKCDGLISGCAITGNTATFDGGGLSFCRGTIISCVISNNTAAHGGGMVACWGDTISCIISGNKAFTKAGAFLIEGPWPTITGCTITGNTAGYCGGIVSIQTSYTKIYNSILSDNTPPEIYTASGLKSAGYAAVYYSVLQSDWPYGGHNIVADPCFANPDANDFHLKSQAGRYDPNSQSWVQDDVTSPAIDTGDPMSPIGFEPFPNGGIINMGAYGGTAEASKSYFGLPLCVTIVAGDINGDCRVNFLDFRLMTLHWLEDNRE